MSMQKQSLPWVLALCALIALAWAFNGLPSWLVVGASVIALVAWLFVNVVMLRGIMDAKDRLNG